MHQPVLAIKVQDLIVLNHFGSNCHELSYRRCLTRKDKELKRIEKKTIYIKYLEPQNTKGISMDPKKVQTILDWRTPCSVWDVQCFLGFANFYCKFIKNYSRVVLPLTELIQKNWLFLWTTSTSNAFDKLKQAFTSAPILIHVDREKPFFIEANASDYALGSILSQIGRWCWQGASNCFSFKEVRTSRN
jgi:hypothetical protein